MDIKWFYDAVYSGLKLLDGAIFGKKYLKLYFDIIFLHII